MCFSGVEVPKILNVVSFPVVDVRVNLGHIKLLQTTGNGNRPVDKFLKGHVTPLHVSAIGWGNVPVLRYLRLAKLVRQYHIYQAHLYLSCILSAAGLHTQLTPGHVDVLMFHTKNIQVFGYLGLSEHKRWSDFVMCTWRKCEMRPSCLLPCFPGIVLALIVKKYLHSIFSVY